ncbi:insulin-like receptor [Neodiprion virginianus]|uniref:insulin-like receptor n=1 Tax=Neodiprion virginianus TaxID=2961670 RepID=UPI001EE6C885|nr:insulin-like receptor [Neodiprion virginianus]XP_046625789.1 insulin-like receptor [Neodiprion virginianus]XP_046625791.1 insulin-like receptor [Neodiprion virginianus]
MKSKTLVVLFFVLGSVLCSEEKDGDIRKTKSVPKQRDKTPYEKYLVPGLDEGGKSSVIDFARDRRIIDSNDSEFENATSRNNEYSVDSESRKLIGPRSTDEDKTKPVVALSKNSHESTPLNMPPSNGKSKDRKRGKYWPTKNSTVKVVDGICPSMDIRNKVENFNTLKECEIIEGFLQIVLIERSEENSFENMTFPKLREITGYLMFYRVNGLKSLTNLFPNLEVIRGQTLMTDYALMVYEMRNLQELGLRNLTEITRGGVIIENNPSLCFVKTINWSLIVVAGDIFIKQNGDSTCPGCSQCNLGYCWTSKHCQLTEKPQCHSECLGWCHGPKDTDCYVCKHFRHDGRCVRTCPAHLYGYLMRRCITQHECLTMKVVLPRNEYAIHEQPVFRPFNHSCIQQCPKGYEDAVDPKNNTATCRKCAGPCRRILPGGTIRNMADAQRYEGVDVVQGGLEIHIQNNNPNLMAELAKSFGSVEEITGYLKVTHSFPITSLSFFKKLRVIKGDPLDSNNSSLTILDNPNLSYLFPKDQNITVQKGRMFFHYNPKLCFSKIEELGRMVDIQNFSKADVDPESNGDKVACDNGNINITVRETGPDFAQVEWKSYEPSSGQHVLGYILNYIATENTDETVFDSNFCGNNTWQAVDVDPSISERNSPKVAKLITDLKPYTRYAVYVKTYTLGNEGSFASPIGQSEIIFFRTRSDVPSPPTNLSSVPSSDTEIMVRWGLPEFPNGPIEYYILSGFVIRDDPELLEERNYCEYGLVDEAHIEDELGVEVTEKVAVDLVTEKSDVDVATRSGQFRNTTRSCCKKDVVESKPAPPMKFAITCNEDISLSRYVPGKQSFCRTSSVSYQKPVIVRGAYEVFSFNVTGENNSYLVKNLKHYSTYTISLAACGMKLENDAEQCSLVEYTSARTLKRQSADDVRNVNVAISNNTIVTISWDPVVEPNGLTVAYKIEYTNLEVRDVKKAEECVTNKEAREKRNTFTLVNLNPGKYSVRVQSMSLAGDGNFSEFHEFLIGIQDHSSMGVIIGLCFAVVAVLVAFVLYLVWKRRQYKMKQIRLIASVNPDYIETKYVLDEWEVPREDVEIMEELGLGNFGMVYRGVLNGTRNVAIKTISVTANYREQNEFLNEASVMKNFSTFHIIKLLGVVSVGSPPFVIMELMENGDLKTYLRKTRDTQLVPNFSRICRMAAEIADGMAYLESKKFVHRDLAARNCMVSKNLVCKIGDFGMARDIYETDYYKIGKKGLLPIRWMAPENLSDGVFTSDSDVWSYGVVLYEILTLAEIPYQGFSNEEVLNYVLRKGTVEIPKNCPEIIYKIMERCFKWRPNDRPTFLEIVSELEPFLSQDFCTSSFYHSSDGVEIRNSGVKKVYHNAAPIRFYFGNETARWVKDFEDNVMLLDQTKAGSSRGRIFKNGFQQFGDHSAMEDVSLDR